ncbi:unnamed protein product [Boreogadus saida]
MQRSLYDTFPDPLDYTGTRGFSNTHLRCTPTQTLPLAQVPTSENRAATPMDLPFPDTRNLKGGWTVQASAGQRFPAAAELVTPTPEGDVRHKIEGSREI